ncbi:MAG TPA: CDP-glycerol glycerophosphotransferase family protein [Flavobacteriaceae bacterium]|nr:CDP-glycerol glycerophosphotransferase family protein [Flavobacteriaceae bacterium]
MKCILFCQNNYAFGILQPIKTYLDKKEHDHLWFVPEKILNDFPYKSDRYTTSIADLAAFQSDAIFVPGNEVPHYLRGVKVQVFHGLAGEKKGHFRIRHYFDLYLTQGPYFTNTFNRLKAIHKNFDVIETGWPKLDVYATDKSLYNNEKRNLLKTHRTKTILLYAPTFSPKLTSAPFLLNQLKTLAQNKDYLILLKFHPLMDRKWIKAYKKLADGASNIIFEDEKNIVKFLLMADLMISDTSSAIYEFVLLDKPVVSFRSISKHIHWDNSLDFTQLVPMVEKNLKEDPYTKDRQYIFEQFHPYNDGKSAERMVEAVEDYIKEHGVPNRRKLSFSRRLKINSMFKKPKSI